MEQRDYNNSEQETTAWNLNQFRTTLVGNLMMKGEDALLDFNLPTDKRIGIRYQCWRSIALAIDNRISPEERKKVKKMEGLYAKYSTRKNPNQLYTQGSDMWKQTRRIPDTSSMRLHSENYIRYIQSLLKKIGLDILSKDDEGDAMD